MRLAIWISLGFSAAVAADQLQLAMPVSLAARVVAGPTWDGAVVLEPEGPGTVRVTVEASLQGGFAGGGWGRWGTRPDHTAATVEARLPLPQELARLERASPWGKLFHTVVWVSTNVRADEGDPGPQDALSVLLRRVGRCSGRANLAVAILRQLGVPARVVHGVLVRGQRVVWHRWGEAWLEGIGWRPFDPGVAVGVAGVRYLPMTGAGEGLPLDGVRVLSVAEWEFNHLPKPQGLRVAWPGGEFSLAARKGGL